MQTVIMRKFGLVDSNKFVSNPLSVAFSRDFKMKGGDIHFNDWDADCRRLIKAKPSEKGIKLLEEGETFDRTAEGHREGMGFRLTGTGWLIIEMQEHPCGGFGTPNRKGP